jgi:hypothetical protein
MELIKLYQLEVGDCIFVLGLFEGEFYGFDGVWVGEEEYFDFFYMGYFYDIETVEE